MSAVDVLIVNYLSADLAGDAVRLLRDEELDIQVWDNSGDFPADLGDDVAVRGDGQNRMFAYGNNELFRSAGSPHVLILNPDVMITPDAVRRLRDELVADPQAWGVMPRLLNPDGSDQNYLRRLPTLRGLLADRFPPLRLLWRAELDRYYCRDVDLTRDGVVEQPPAACLMVKRAAAGDTLFDEDYPLFFNDADLARRLNATGHCRYVASVTATHVGGASISRARRRGKAWIRREYDRSLLRYARRNFRGGYLLAPVVALRISMGYLLSMSERPRRRRG